jgi:hypothetical protein
MFEPDNFRKNPYGYTTNQTSHSFLVGCIGLVYLPVLADGPAINTGRSQVTGNVLRATTAGIVGISSQSGNMIIVA